MEPSDLNRGFQPQNQLEKALVRASIDPEFEPSFLRSLLDSEILVLPAEPFLPTQNGKLKSGTGFHVLECEFEGQRYLPFFTSLPRLEATLKKDCRYLTISARIFLENTKGALLYLNPGSLYGREILPEDVQKILSGSLFDA